MPEMADKTCGSCGYRVAGCCYFNGHDIPADNPACGVWDDTLQENHLLDAMALEKGWERTK